MFDKQTPGKQSVETKWIFTDSAQGQCMIGPGWRSCTVTSGPHTHLQVQSQSNSSEGALSSLEEVKTKKCIFSENLSNNSFCCRLLPIATSRTTSCESRETEPKRSWRTRRSCTRGSSQSTKWKFTLMNQRYWDISRNRFYNLFVQVEKLQVRLDKSYAEKDKLEAKLEYSQSELGKLKAELDKTSSDQNFKYNDYNDGRQKITKLELEIERLRQENDRYFINLQNIVGGIFCERPVITIKIPWEIFSRKVVFFAFSLINGCALLRCPVRHFISLRPPLIPLQSCKM